MFTRITAIAVIVGVPLSVLAVIFNWMAEIQFIIFALTIIALATYIGRATDSLSILTGPRVGGLLNVTFGNAVELIITIFALRAGMISIVLASLTGAVISNLLLVGGMAFFIGGIKYKRQQFNIYDAWHNAGLLMFAIVIAFVVPAIFSTYLTDAETMTLSIWIACIMFILYGAALFFKLVTHRGVYQKEGTEEEEPEWTKYRALIILIAATLAVAFISENLVDTFENLGESFGWSEIFIGVIVVAIIGNAAENITAILMAYKDKLEVSVEIAVGSTLQIAMFVAPILVLLSLFFPTPMPLLFSTPELVAMILSVLLAIMIVGDGDTNWFEGLTLLAAYLIMGVGFYFL